MPFEVRLEPQIVDGLQKTFVIGELGQLIAARFNLNIQHWTPVNPHADARDYYAGIVANLNKRDLLGDLIVAALVERPRNAKLVAAGEELGVTASGRLVDKEGRIEVGANLEKAVRDIEQRIDPAVLRERLGEAEQRTGSVETGGEGFGTAFLIAADRVITNWHVAKLIYLGHISPSAVKIRFDWKRDVNGTKEYPGVTVGLSTTQWLVAGRNFAKFDVEPPEQPDPKANELDYAVLALDSPIGEQDMDTPVVEASVKRGWFDFGKAAEPPAVGEPVFVLGHPRKQPLTISMGKVLGHVGQGRRMRHDAWSVSGSSGSPVFNADGQLVGLHHGTEPMSGVKARYNQAIPITLVAADSASGQTDF